MYHGCLRAGCVLNIDSCSTVIRSFHLHSLLQLNARQFVAAVFIMPGGSVAKHHTRGIFLLVRWVGQEITSHDAWHKPSYLTASS
jgi:hypothetical protein